MLTKHNEEMDSYKNRKFRAHNELECVRFGLENVAINEQTEAENHHLNCVDKIKSRV